MTVTFQVGDREFGGAGNLEIDFWVGVPLSRALCEVESALSSAEIRSFVDSPQLYYYTATCYTLL